MARLLQCDKCGASFDDRDPKEFKHIREIRYEETGGIRCHLFDLCDKCFDDVMAFIGTNKNKEK